jgi:hypothetical protein
MCIVNDQEKKIQKPTQQHSFALSVTHDGRHHLPIQLVASLSSKERKGRVHRRFPFPPPQTQREPLTLLLYFLAGLHAATACSTANGATMHQ